MNVQALFEPRNRHVSEIEAELRQWRALGLAAVAVALLMSGIVIGKSGGCVREPAAEVAAYEQTE